MKKYLEDIIEFRKAFDLPIGATESSFTPELHESLLVEELVELCDATNLIDVADAIIDSCYVSLGRLVHGMGYDVFHIVGESPSFFGTMKCVAEVKGIDFDRCWDEIHRSNMSKLCASEAEVVETSNFYANKGITIEATHQGDTFVIKCAEDTDEIKAGKVLKSINYSPADLGFLNEA